jgi:hypothetical protein
VEKTGGILVAKQIQTSLTVSGFHRLESRKPCIRILEDAKSETLNRRKVP